jgi:DNA-binding MarR family transcriptional regulator
MALLPNLQPDDARAGAAELFDLDHHVFYWMTQVMGRRDRQLGAELRRHRLRVPEWRVLALLKGRQPVSLGEAAVTVGLDHTTMSRTVDRMVRAGRILRLSDTADMRVTRLGLTAAGARLFEQVWPIVLRLNREALARLPEGSIPLLCLALREMGRAMDESWQIARQNKKSVLTDGGQSRRAAGGSTKESRS